MRRQHTLRRRYGHSRYSHRQSPANAIQENVYLDSRLIGTVISKAGGYEWWLSRVPQGWSFHLSGKVRSKAEGVRKVIEASQL